MPQTALDSVRRGLGPCGLRLGAEAWSLGPWAALGLGLAWAWRLRRRRLRLSLRIEERRRHTGRAGHGGARRRRCARLRAACRAPRTRPRPWPGQSSASAPATRWTTSCGRPAGCRRTPARPRATPWPARAAAARPRRRAPRRRASRRRGRRCAARGPRARSRRERGAADEGGLARGRRADRGPSRTASRAASASAPCATLKKSTSIRSSPASMRATSSASSPVGRRPNAGRPLMMRVPHGAGVVAIDPDLVAEIAGVAGARDLDRPAGDARRWSRGSTSGRRCPRRRRRCRSAADVGPCSASAATRSEMSSTVTSRPAACCADPAQVRLRRGPAEPMLLQPRHRAVVEHAAVLVAPRRVDHLARLQLASRRA